MPIANLLRSTVQRGQLLPKNTLEIMQLYVLRSLVIPETWILDSTTWEKQICHSHVTQNNHKF